MKKLIYLNCLFLLLCWNLLAQIKPDFRLVVTGGLQGLHQGDEAFYESPLFRLGKDSPISIKNTQVEADTDGFAVYFPADSQVQDGYLLSSSQLFAFAPKKNTALERTLGAVSSPVKLQKISRKSQKFYRLSLASNLSSSPKKLQKINAVLAVDSKGNAYYFFPRNFQSTLKAFELVDQFLKKSSDIPTRFIDLGNALTSYKEENLENALKMNQLLQARNPAVLALGRFDLGVLSQIPKSPVYISAFVGPNAPPLSRQIQLGRHELTFLALGGVSIWTSGFLDKSLKPITLLESIESLNQQNHSFIIGLSENRDSAAKAIEYPILDMVFSLTFLNGGALPEQDDINLSENNQLLGVRTVAPLVRISPSDVTQVSVWLNKAQKIQRILIERKPIVAQIAQQKEFYPILLPEKTWKESDFRTYLANLLLNTYPESEVIIFEKRPDSTPIDSGLSLPLAENLIALPGRSIEISLGGSYLKQVLKAISEKQLGLDVFVVNTLQRELSAAETYKLVVTEKVLSTISDFIAQESLFASSSNPSSSLQIALAESNKDAIKLLPELRKRENKSIYFSNRHHALIQNTPTITELVRDAVQEPRAQLETRPERSILLLDISDLDLGIKANFTNNTLANWQTAPNAYFDENRFWDKDYFNLLFYSKIGLSYLMPKLELGISHSIKYYQPNRDSANPKNIQDIRPAKDSVKLEADARIPLNFFVSPLTRLSYETQLWPNSLFTKLPSDRWPRRVHDMRLFLGVSKKPRLGYELFRVGALLGYDFSRNSPEQSLGAGFELGGAYQYQWTYLTFKVDSSLRKLFPIVNNPDTGRMGTIWLTDLKLEVPVIAEFSLSAMSNLTVGEQMNHPWTYGVGCVFGLALSYGNRVKWLF